MNLFTVNVLQTYSFYTVEAKKTKDSVVLTNPVDIERHKQFKKAVNDLKKYGYMRRYTSEIKKRTGEDTGNITRYYKGNLPIGDNFLKKFKKAYASELRRIRKEIKGADRPLASNTPIKLPQADPTRMPPNTTSAGPLIFDSEKEIASLLRVVIEKLVNIQEAIELLAKKIDIQSKTTRKKK